MPYVASMVSILPFGAHQIQARPISTTKAFTPLSFLVWWTQTTGFSTGPHGGVFAQTSLKRALVNDKLGLSDEDPLPNGDISVPYFLLETIPSQVSEPSRAGLQLQVVPVTLCD